MNQNKRHIAFSRSQLDQMVKEGKIRGYEGYTEPKPTKKHQFNTGRIITKFYPTKSKEKNSIIVTLLEWSQERGYKLYEEYYFHPERKWRFDWCVPEIMLAVEYEGVFSEKSRHTNMIGFSNDTRKYNEAKSLGWKVYRYTAITYREMEVDLASLVTHL